MKIYLVQTIDTWNNSELIGFYTDLKEAEKIIKGEIAEVKIEASISVKEYKGMEEE